MNRTNEITTPETARKRGWKSLTYTYKDDEVILLRAAVWQLGSKPHLVLAVPGGKEIFVPGETNLGLK